MSLKRARIVRAAFPPAPLARAAAHSPEVMPSSQETTAPGAPGIEAVVRAEARAAAIAAELAAERGQRRGRRVAASVLAAEARAAAIVAEAEAKATAIARAAAAAAATDARADAEARLAAGFLALHAAEQKQRAAAREQAVDLAILLAERLVGETLAVEPARVGELAAAALAETRGATKIELFASPEDVPALSELLRDLGSPAGAQPSVTVDPSLGRGSLVVQTDVGRVDARLDVQLARLAVALRRALTEAAR